MSELAKRHGVVDNPRRVCLIPRDGDESNERGIAIIVAVLEVGQARIVLGVTGEDDVARAIRTVFDWKTGLAAEGKLKELKLPPSELARIEEFDTQGSYE